MKLTRDSAGIPRLEISIEEAGIVFFFLVIAIIAAAFGFVTWAAFTQGAR